MVSAGVHVLSPGQKVNIYQEKAVSAGAPVAPGAGGPLASVPAGAQAATLPAAK